MEVQEELPQNFNNNLFPAVNPAEAMIEPEGSTSNTILVEEQTLTVDQNDTRNQQNNQNEPMEEVEEAPEAEDPAQDEGTESNVEKRCDFCGYTCNEGVLFQEHIQDCELRKIWCDKCEQRVIIDIFDAHYNDCNADREGSEAEEQEGNQEGNMEEEGNGENQGRQQQARPRRNRTSMYLPESSLTYEQLLLLDETIVKKGLTTEQLKKFRVRVYVKSLDGEGFCNICMCNYNTGEYTRELTCRHKFHECCIDQWLGMNITCPTCKKYFR